MTINVTAAQVRAFRVRRQQLDREHGTLDDTAVLDIGVQDTGPAGARCAMADRGVADVDPTELVPLWTVRGAPHCYRRADLPQVVAAAPYSEADAAKRIHDAASRSRPPASRCSRRSTSWPPSSGTWSPTASSRATCRRP